jgi:hypothetical protein
VPCGAKPLARCVPIASPPPQDVNGLITEDECRALLNPYSIQSGNMVVIVRFLFVENGETITPEGGPDPDWPRRMAVPIAIVDLVLGVGAQEMMVRAGAI